MPGSDYPGDESRFCLECGADLEARCFEVYGVSVVRYRCPVHGVTALLEFI